MKKSILIYGGITGTILCANMIYMVNLCYSSRDFESSEFLGYASMIIVFSMIYFGIRNYRNRYADGLITFGKALMIGTWIALIGSTMYVAVWLFYYYLFVPDFIDIYLEHLQNNMIQNGATAQELADNAKEMLGFKEMYNNPLFVILITYSEVFPVGFLVALISSAILRRKTKKGDPVKTEN